MKKEYIKVKISELKNWEKNPKKHDEKLIENSIKEFGYIEPIIIDEKNKIIVGHGRLKVLKKLGIEEVEAIRIEGLNEKQKEKYALLANRAVERGGWDWELLLSFDEEVLRESGFEIFEEKIEDKEIKEEEEKQFEKEVYCVVTFKNNEEIINFFKMFSVEEFDNLIENGRILKNY
jgi:ParB-like chromosome segregation protein Spo0J